MKRENNMHSVTRIRDCVTGLKLIRKYKGKLIPTKLGSSLAQDPQAMAEYMIETLRAVANMDVYVDSGFSEWAIRAGGYRPDKFGYGGEPVKNYVDVSEILVNFGTTIPMRRARFRKPPISHVSSRGSILVASSISGIHGVKKAKKAISNYSRSRDSFSRRRQQD
ncbi:MULTISPECIES: hypothetical protein [unclassified Arthrobacter]|uniref:hypothetical protein n=1 Tax=unclassified Arthrobacter TaxID=235627 RepID=UPI0011B00189|nr:MULTISPECIES: hypothetical protein [unclassified Arthrobacter]